MDKAVKTPEPVTLQLAKAHCRIDTSDEDTLIEQVYIPAARQTVEQYTGLALLPAQATCYMVATVCTPHSIPLPQTPASSVDSLTAIQDDGTRVALDLVAYGATIATREMHSIVFTEGALPDAATYEVGYTSGYPDGALPPNLLLAMLDLVGDAYENREAQQAGVVLQRNPRAVALMDPFRIEFGI